MSARFLYGNSQSKRPVSPDQPWPIADGQRGQYVTLEHSILGVHRLIVHDWANGIVQLERLNDLQAAGYAHRRDGSTDWSLWHTAHLIEGHSGVFDHPWMFRHGDDSVIVCHTYSPADHVQAVLPGVCALLSEKWHCQIRCEIDDRFNIYWPTNGVGFEIRRPRSVRGPRRVWS